MKMTFLYLFHFSFTKLFNNFIVKYNTISYIQNIEFRKLTNISCFFFAGLFLVSLVGVGSGDASIAYGKNNSIH